MPLPKKVNHLSLISKTLSNSKRTNTLKMIDKWRLLNGILKFEREFALQGVTLVIFARFKSMKWWAQSFIVGIPKIVVGYRDDNVNYLLYNT